MRLRIVRARHYKCSKAHQTVRTKDGHLGTTEAVSAAARLGRWEHTALLCAGAEGIKQLPPLRMREALRSLHETNTTDDNQQRHDTRVPGYPPVDMTNDNQQCHDTKARKA